MNFLACLDREMNKTAIRNRFKYYRAEIGKLNNIIYNLEESASEQAYYQEDALSRAEARAESCRRNAEQARRDAEYEAECRADDVRRATRELERARDWNDDWSEERALRKLRNIW